MRYCGRSTAQISFPLGGIGTGSIGLGGNGRFLDVEIGNAPNKDSSGEFTHFAVKAERNGRVLDARVLQGDLQPPYVGHGGRPLYTGYGFGPDRGSMAGMPHFADCEFDGAFPLARLAFSDEHFPGSVELLAFNPLIPTDTFDSSLPAAFFTILIRNDTQEAIEYTVAFSLRNFFTETGAIHQFLPAEGRKALFLSDTADRNTTDYGDLTMATDAECVSYQEYWKRGGWIDGLHTFWREFASPGPLPPRSYDPAARRCPQAVPGDMAVLAAHVVAAPGETRTVRFVLTWSKPWRTNTWELKDPTLSEKEIHRRRTQPWKNYYATQFETSRETAAYCLEQFSRLERETRDFHDALFSSTLPPEVLDAVSANMAVLKSPTCLRLEDGSFYAFEGVHQREGSCEGTCTHVWSYAYALAYLFPELERSARTLEYTYSMQPHGGMGFRVQLPLGAEPIHFRPCVDGQFGSVIRTYREYMLSGDLDWLKGIWPQVKRSISFSWSAENPDRWDLDRDGLIEGRQHHTLDVELFGPNSWLSGMYLTGLQAAARLARILGEPETALE